MWTRTVKWDVAPPAWAKQIEQGRVLVRFCPPYLSDIPLEPARCRCARAMIRALLGCPATKLATMFCNPNPMPTPSEPPTTRRLLKFKPVVSRPITKPSTKMTKPEDTRSLYANRAESGALTIFLLIPRDQTSHGDCDVEHTRDCLKRGNHPSWSRSGNYIAISHCGQHGDTKIQKSMARSLAWSWPPFHKRPGINLWHQVEDRVVEHSQNQIKAQARV